MSEHSLKTTALTVSDGESKQSIKDEKDITYDKLFLLFIMGSLLGVMIEGCYCLFKKGHWESHVVSVIGHFNILYGSGAVLFFAGAALLKKKNIALRATILMLIATVLEFIVGLVLKYGLGMRAWNYENKPLNIEGIICVRFSLMWGLAALAFCLVFPIVNKFLNKFKGKAIHFACIGFSIFMALNLAVTGMAIARWSQRHYGDIADSKFELLIDRTAPDDWMRSRFMEWEFLDEVTKKNK